MPGCLSDSCTSIPTPSRPSHAVPAVRRGDDAAVRGAVPGVRAGAAGEVPRARPGRSRARVRPEDERHAQRGGAEGRLTGSGSLARVPHGRAREAADLYAVLGVDASASGDEIARAFRDPGQGAPSRHERRSRGGRTVQRARDRVRRARRTTAPGASTTSAHRRAGAVAPWHRIGCAARRIRSRRGRRAGRARRAWTALVGGHAGDAARPGRGGAHLAAARQTTRSRRARFLPVDARRGSATATSRSRPANGRIVRTKEPQQHGEGNGLGPTVRVRYDPADPSHVIVDASTLGPRHHARDRRAEVAVGGPVFVVLGCAHLRRHVRRATAAR